MQLHTVGAIPTMSQEQFFRMAALFDLATGEGKRDLTKITNTDQKDYQSQYLAVAYVHDMILRCTRKYPLHAQLIFGHALGCQNCSNPFWDLLSALLICYGRFFSDKKQCDVRW